MNSKKKICFLANDYDFFFRHFSSAVQAAKACGAEATVLLPTSNADRAVIPRDAGVVPSPIDRRLAVTPIPLQTLWLILQLRKIRPDVIVVFSVRSAMVVALARPFVGRSRVVVYVTGLGLLSLLTDPLSRAARFMTHFLVRRLGSDRHNHFIFENLSDRADLGFRHDEQHHQSLFWGAGVDPNEFSPRTWPVGKTLRLASVSRLVWSKGVDLAAQAVSELSKEGYAVTLDIYGDPDHLNPRPIDPQIWASMPAVFFHGHTEDVSGVWEKHHAGIFASRGGEGLPRALLEAAACGRPSLVTNVPGCADFVVDGVTGYVTQPNSVSALKAAIKRMIYQREGLPELGAAARKRCLETSTAQVIREEFERVFRSVL